LLLEEIWKLKRSVSRTVFSLIVLILPFSFMDRSVLERSLCSFPWDRLLPFSIHSWRHCLIS
jgi:hypothetical protein